MTCKQCDSKGYIESYQADGGFKTPKILQCNECRNIAGYSKRVQEMYRKKAEEPLTAKIFQFTKRGQV